MEHFDVIIIGTGAGGGTLAHRLAPSGKRILLLERGVALTGCDTWSYGPVPAEHPERPFEVPQILNVRHGVLIVENLDLSALAADGVREFCLILTHPKLRGATGAWTSPVALV